MNWMDVLKLDAVNIGSSVLDTRELPEETDCCEEAKTKYKSTMVLRQTQGVTGDPKLYVGGTMGLLGIADKYDCEEFRKYLRERSSGDISMESIFEEWEECENA
jgi:hypothetical protein